MGDDALGAMTGNWYSAELDYPINRKFVEAIRRDYKTDPGVYAAETYVCAEVLEHAAQGDQRQGRGQGRLHEGAKEAKVPNTLRGPVRFDEFGNVVGNIYIRKVGRRTARYVNAVVKTYPDVEPVLDLQARRVPEESGLFARLPAGQESRAVIRPPCSGDAAFASTSRTQASRNRCRG